MIHHLFPGRAEHHIPPMIDFFKSITAELRVAPADQAFVFCGASPEQFERYAACLPPGSRAVSIGRSRLELFGYVRRIESGRRLR